ncbi:MAG TPA: hypothetical protein VEA69_16655 [Tepidisphaeraceae bacterium]|nr:hypothetical protein [Tepidisphaeraceae bacterium]
MQMLTEPITIIPSPAPDVPAVVLVRGPGAPYYLAVVPGVGVESAEDEEDELHRVGRDADLAHHDPHHGVLAVRS